MRCLNNFNILTISFMSISCNYNTKEMGLIDNKVKALQAKIHEEIYARQRGGGKKERRKFMKACPAEGCRGFLSTQWKCGMCSTHVCSKCFVIKPVDGAGNFIEHECKESDLQSADLIR